MNDPASPTSSQPSPAYSLARYVEASHPQGPAVERCVPGQFAKHAGLCDLREIEVAGRGAAREARALGIDHHGDVPLPCRGGDRPGPSRVVRLDEGVRIIRHLPRGFAPPLRHQRHRPRTLVVGAQALRARQQAGAPGAIEDERGARRREIALDHRPAFDRDTSQRGLLEEDLLEPVRVDLPAARVIGERFRDAVRRCPTTPCCRAIE